MSSNAASEDLLLRKFVWMFWTGWVISTLVTIMLLLSAAMKFVQPPMVVEGFTKAGFDTDLLIPIGVLEVVCVLIYAFPRTAVLGAILLTGYLGGATVTHVRVHEPWYGAVIIGVLVWVGLLLREPRLHTLLPIRW